MKKYLLLYAVLATALLLAGYRRYRSETRRLVQNQTALSSEVEHYRTRLGEEAASAQVLRLRCSEFERLRADDARRIRALGVKLRRLEAAATTVTATSVAFRAPLQEAAAQYVVPMTEDEPVRPAAAAPHPDRAVAGVRTHEPQIVRTVYPPIAGTRRDPFPAHAPDRRPGAASLPLPRGHERVFRWHDAWVSVEGVVAGDSVACRVRSVDTLRQIVHRIPRRFLFIRWGTKALRQEIVSSNPHTRIVYTRYVKIER